jgi:NADH-quinone oxidoreductase subunit L
MYTAIVLMPLVGSAIAGLLGRFIGARGAEVITCVLVSASAILSMVAFNEVALRGEEQHIVLFTFIDSGALEADWAIRVDTLTAVMLLVVTGVSALVHIYSVGYMHEDPHRPRFFSYLSFFTFAMLTLVTAPNFVQLFFGWEGVGLASYLLIGFWYERPSANAAAIKAFIVNRVGDFGFALGICAVFFVFNSVDFDTVFAAVRENRVLLGAPVQELTQRWVGLDVHVLTAICLLLFMGAMGKSAQILLHTWLPDAMEGPTPVSALIHAATMVTAGVFLVCRASPLFEHAPLALEVVTVVGAVTAFVTATIGLVQNDIKRVIAYSTCSQLGYMFFAAGLSAYGAAMFHLFTHAFFKALLFLGAGSVIHALGGEQDMRKMGRLYNLVPFTWLLMAIGTLSLTGFPFTAGYFSKDSILEHAYGAGTQVAHLAYSLGIVTAFMTSFYSWRLMFLTFHGEHRQSKDVLEHVHESPRVMLMPLVVLAFGALGAGAVFQSFFVGEAAEKFWRGSITVLTHHEEVPLSAIALMAPVALSLAGLAIAWFFYVRRPDIPRALARGLRPLYLFLLNKWYFDELYDALFVRPAKSLGRVLWQGGDGRIIDGLGPDGVSARVLDAARRIVRLQTGYLYHYAFAMLIGLAILITYYTFWLAPR